MNRKRFIKLLMVDLDRNTATEVARGAIVLHGSYKEAFDIITIMIPDESEDSIDEALNKLTDDELKLIMGDDY